MLRQLVAAYTLAKNLAEQIVLLTNDVPAGAQPGFYLIFSLFLASFKSPTRDTRVDFHKAKAYTRLFLAFSSGEDTAW